jgi:uncharacterized protein YkwD
MRAWSRNTLAALLGVAGLLAAGVNAHAATSVSARAQAAAEACESADAVPTQVGLIEIQDATLCLMNAERQARGLEPLRAQATLAGAAGRYARAMVRQQFFDHTSPGGSTMLSRIKATSYLDGTAAWSVGENLAWGTGPLATPRATVKAWMQSPGHRANLLERRFRDVGIGIATGAPVELDPDEVGATYVTDFGRRLRA